MGAASIPVEAKVDRTVERFWGRPVILPELLLQDLPGLIEFITVCTLREELKMLEKPGGEPTIVTLPVTRLLEAEIILRSLAPLAARHGKVIAKLGGEPGDVHNMDRCCSCTIL